MTPLLRTVHERFMQTDHKSPYYEAAVQMCREALCFEVTGVRDLVNETLVAMNAGVLGTAEHPLVGHGGLLLLPSPITWIEWLLPADMQFPKSDRVGAMLLQPDPEDETITIEATSLSALDLVSPEPLKSRIHLFPDEMCRVEVFKGDHRSDTTTQLAGNIGVICLANLLVLNAPYGIRKDPQPLHKAHAREAIRIHGFELKPHRVVTLDKTRPPPCKSEHNLNGPAFHKAFHFVRQHLRHYQDGGRTHVRAHWRGDPRLGVCPMPDYRVRP